MSQLLSQVVYRTQALFSLLLFSSCSFRQTNKLTFQIPSSTLRLSEMFGRLESSKAQLNIVEYSLSQTTLEQIFNKFAAQQEHDKGKHIGLLDDGPSKAAK